jgi:hypothetical protein
LLQRRSGLLRYLGIAALFSWFAIAIYNATQDSFATPNIWINLGIVVGLAAYALESESVTTQQNAPSAILPEPLPRSDVGTAVEAD